MLKARVITAVILIVCLLAAFYFLTSFQLSVLFAGVFGVAAWEWSNLAGLAELHHKVLFVSLIIGLFALFGLFLGLPTEIDASLVWGVTGLALVWWLLAAALITTYPNSAIIWRPVMVRLFLGLLILSSAWVSLVYLLYLHDSSWLVLLVLVLVSLADSGAYFAGKSFGRHKLAPLVSPGKTWEGVFGGLLSIVCLWVILIVQLDVAPQQWAWLAVLLLMPALTSIIGDLFESVLKRTRGIKDSGCILPGHGGVLDRIDGVVAALPVFTMLLLLSGFSF